MSIWEYSNQSEDAILVGVAANSHICLYCGTLLNTIQSGYVDYLNSSKIRNPYRDYTPPPSQDSEIKGCSTCGWWSLISNRYGTSGDLYSKISSGAIGSLKNLDLADISTPVKEVRAFLTAKYTSRFQVHPKLFEETVASVFRDLGYHVRVTGFTRDGGIDIILDSPDEGVIGVQVKRYQNKIGVEQIRTLTGALLLRGYTKGVFVTTSEFSCFAKQEAKVALSKGYPIELYNSEKFFDALKITQRKQYGSEIDFFNSIDTLTTLTPLEGGNQHWNYWRPLP